MKFLVATILISGVVMMQYALTDAPTASTGVPHGMDSRIHPSHLSEGKFRGGKDPMRWSLADFASTTWDFLFTGNARTPDRELPLKQVDLTHFTNPGKSQLNATWLGHSSLMVNMDGYRILTDPVFQKRVSIVGPTRFNGDVPIDIRQVPEVDVVIISHDHYDHLNKHSVRHLEPKTKQFIVPTAVGTLLAKWGVPAEKIVELDWWETFRFDPDLAITATPAQHFSGRGLTGRNKTLWASWVVTSPAHKIFFSGDSGYFDGFKQIGEAFGPFDMTFIECGAYNQSWAQVHMFPEQTVRAHKDLGGDVLHPIHWGTFNLALHPWYEPMERLTAAANTANTKIAVPVVGDTTVYNAVIPGAKWWREAMTPPLKLLGENTR